MTQVTAHPKARCEDTKNRATRGSDQQIPSPHGDEKSMGGVKIQQLIHDNNGTQTTKSKLISTFFCKDRGSKPSWAPHDSSRSRDEL